MDNPRDIRYRYNRGCADYQASDFKGAMAAFSSVLKRTDDPETRVKAVFNLGNAAFKQGDFASAKAYYQQAIVLDPTNENARFNLELTLRELEKQKKQEKEQQQQKDQKKEGSQKEKNEGDKKKLHRRRQRRSNRKIRIRKRMRNLKRSHMDSGAQKPDKDSEPEARKPEQVPAARIQKQKAEALLDNIKEDRARFLKFQVPEAKGQGKVRKGLVI